MISEAYKEQQKELHNRGQYGIQGKHYAESVKNLAEALKTHDILDYGCGQRTLEKEIGFLIRNYDPCIEEFSEPPQLPADIVVCTDVLEHIEPEHIDAVLDDLKRLTRKFGFFVVATGPAQKTLADGRNAHLIQESANWWLPKIMSRFRLKQFQAVGQSFIVVVKP